MRPARGFGAKAVGSFVPKLAAAAFERYGFHTAEIMTSWPTIVSPDIARLARPEAIRWPRGAKQAVESDGDGGQAKGATLIVACDPSFALEISYRTRDILDRINRYFGYRAIAEMKVLQTPWASETAKPTAATPPRPTAASPSAATGMGDLAAALAALGASVGAGKAG